MWIIGFALLTFIVAAIVVAVRAWIAYSVEVDRRREASRRVREEQHQRTVAIIRANAIAGMRGVDQELAEEWRIAFEKPDTLDGFLEACYKLRLANSIFAATEETIEEWERIKRDPQRAYERAREICVDRQRPFMEVMERRLREANAIIEAAEWSRQRALQEREEDARKAAAARAYLQQQEEQQRLRSSVESSMSRRVGDDAPEDEIVGECYYCHCAVARGSEVHDYGHLFCSQKCADDEDSWWDDD